MTAYESSESDDHAFDEQMEQSITADRLMRNYGGIRQHLGSGQRGPLAVKPMLREWRGQAWLHGMLVAGKSDEDLNDGNKWISC